MRVLFTLQYLGTRYAGWQEQSNALGIQSIVEAALTRLCKEPVTIIGAGRTDSGVHAAGQRAHADIPITIAPRGLMLGLNDLLPHDIRIVEVREVPATFHARFDAISKTYVYRIWNQEWLDIFHRATHAHVMQRLDHVAMHEASGALVGTHDFRSFTVLRPEVSSTTRTISSIRVERLDDTVTITVTADGFLRFMVRRIAGSLIEVGRGKIPVDALARQLEPHYEQARWTAPAEGLTLLRVEYAEELQLN